MAARDSVPPVGYVGTGGIPAPVQGASGGSVGIGGDGLGIQLRDWATRPILAKITSHGTANAYAWSQVFRSASGTFTVQPGGLTGTTTVSPAYEVNGRTDVAANTIVELWPNYGVPGAFCFACSPAAGDSFWAEITGSSGGAEPGTLYSWKKKVLDSGTHLFVDASPAVTGTDTLKRVPSPAGVDLVIMPNGVVVRAWPSPTDAGKYECTGGFVTNVYCQDGELVVRY